MKSYTDIEQSQKLSEILPYKSADMYYHNRVDIPDNFPLPIEWKRNLPLLSQEIPCWSLAALLEIIPEPILTYIDENNWNISTFKDNHFKEEVISTNPLNACYEMILKLHEQNLL